MIPRPDLLDAHSPAGLEVSQLTTEVVPSCHVYMEAQIFSPDSKRFLLHRSAHPHGSDKFDPEHRYLLCDLENGGELSPVTDELGATAPAVSPDGRFFYYIVDETEPNGGRFSIKRRAIDGTAAETLLTVDTPLPGSRYRAGRVYPLSTVRSDGRKLAFSAYFGDGLVPGHYGLVVFDIPTASAEVVLQGPTYSNLHPQYSRSQDPTNLHDLMIQENHGGEYDAHGNIISHTGGDSAGCDMHLIHDDGTDKRDFPWGRNGHEFCQGHQCWRGRTDWAIGAADTETPNVGRLIESRAVPGAGDLGIGTPNAVRNDITRNQRHRYYHFATDIEGRTLVTDGNEITNDILDFRPDSLYQAQLGAPGEGAFEAFSYLLSPRSSIHRDAHIHPFLSPDGKTAFFNSDESGTVQAYMVRGLPF